MQVWKEIKKFVLILIVIYAIFCTILLFLSWPVSSSVSTTIETETITEYVED